MRVAIDAIPLVENKTGVGHYTDALAEWLALTHSDHQYELISPFDFSLPQNPPPNLSKRFMPVRSIFRKWWLVGLPSLLNISPVDVFHGTNYCIPVFSPCPTVVTIHDLSLWTHGMTHEDANVRRGKRRIPVMARRATKIIAPSEATKREIVEHLGIEEPRICVIPEAARPHMQPLPPDAVSPVLQKYDITSPYLLFIGTIEPRKNLLRLIRAYRDLISTTEFRPALVVGGGRGWKDAEVFDLVAELKLEGMVRFTGYVPDEDLPALYSGASVFVYPSLYEGFGLPPLEAMACGVPVITSNTSSLPEVVGDAGVTVDPLDTSGLTMAITEFLSNPGAMGHYRQAGLERAAMFSWERAANETQSIYDQVYEEAVRKRRG